MHFIKPLAFMALAIGTWAAPAPKHPWKSEMVDYLHMSTHPCFLSCVISTSDYYDVRTHTRWSFCKGEEKHNSNDWILFHLDKCVNKYCPKDEMKDIRRESRAWFKSYCGY